jgi:hypothetical protein
VLRRQYRGIRYFLAIATVLTPSRRDYSVPWADLHSKSILFWSNHRACQRTNKAQATHTLNACRKRKKLYVEGALGAHCLMICSYCIDEISIDECAVSKDHKWFHASRTPEGGQNRSCSCWVLSEHGTKTLYHSEVGQAASADHPAAFISESRL